MRLRICITRNGLPAVHILFNVEEPSCTISKLLELVDGQIPLESEHWGLEDYVVTLDGYECLHYSPVDQILQNDDKINIHPLAQAERKARRLSGRVQITSSGAHLLDGIPYGRPYLRPPSRPSIRIPPRKRRRTTRTDDETEPEAEDSDAHQVLFLTDQVNQADISRSSPPLKIAPFRRDPARQGRVHFSSLPENDKDKSVHGIDEVSSSDDFDPEQPTDTSDSSEEDDDKSSSNSASTSEEDSDSDSDYSSSSGQEAESSVSSEPQLSATPDVQTNMSTSYVPPGQGSKDTQMRNRRRSRSRKLRHLKSTGALPSHATNTDAIALANAQPALVVASSSDQTSPNAAARALNVEYDAASNDQNTLPSKDILSNQLGDTISTKSSVQTPRINIASSRRLLFGSLGVRAPKTQEEAQRLRLKLDMVQKIRGQSPKTSAVQKDHSKPSVDCAWQQSINLSAVECDGSCAANQGDLSMPPYPFYQRWDQSQRPRGKKRKYTSMLSQEEDVAELETGTDGSPVSHAAPQVATTLDEPVGMEEATDDLPTLPADIQQLAPLSLVDCQKGAVITYQCYEVSAATNWSPALSPRKTAQVSDVHGSRLELVLAKRDRARKQAPLTVDGKRLYGAFEGPDLDSDDDVESGEGGSSVQISFSELVDARLVQSIRPAQD